MRNVIGSLIFLMASLLGQPALAQVVTFDELGGPTNPILGTIACTADGTGFRFLSDHFHFIGGSFPEDYSSNGTTVIGYESGRGFPIVMERVGGGTFSLLSVDAAEFYSSESLDRPNAQTIRIDGFQFGGGTVSYTFSLDGVFDGPGGAVDFQHIVLPSTFVNLTSIVFTGLRAGDLSGGISIDNVEYYLPSPEVLGPCVATPVPSATTVFITSPSAGSVSGMVPVEAVATAGAGVASVLFSLDGVNLGAPDTTAPYTISWDTTTVPDGLYTLTAEARDTGNNPGTASVVVTVQNAPVVVGTPHYVNFDGVDDHVRVPDTNALSFGTGVVDSPLTFEFWFRPDALTRQQLLGKGSENATEYRLFIASGGLRLDLRDASANATVSVYTDSLTALVGAWHHLAVVYDGRGGATAATGVTFYIDGVAVPVTRANNPAYVAMENLSGWLEIGRESTSWRQYDGALDELRLWTVARTLSEIQAGMTVELSGAEPGLVGYWRFNDGTGVTATDSGPVGLPAGLFNGTAWVAGGAMTPVEPDVTPPTITDLGSSNLTASGVTITFTTSEVATGRVSYTASTACPCVTVNSAGPGTTHVVTLTGLASDTLYQAFVDATDASNNQQVSSAFTFRTLVAPPDSTPPAVAIVRPSGTVTGTAVVEATASDNVGVASVQFTVDGVNLGAPDTTAPYTISWDTTTVPDGPHTISAEARDAANNVATASAVVTVSQTPLPSTPHYVNFDGVNDHVRVPDTNALSFGTGVVDSPLTFELWLRPDVLTRQQLLGKGSENATEYRLFIASGGLRLDLRDASANATVSVYTDSLTALVGAWHHLAVVYDGRGGATAATGVTFYIDGVAVPVTRANNPAYVAMENLSGWLEIGRESTSWRQYDGALDELRLWTVARTLSEIQAGMTVELSGAEPGLVGYWRFNDGTGVTATDSGPVGLPAGLFNGTAWVAGGAMTPVEPDVTPPTITDLGSSNLTASGVTITFTTSEVATGRVSYTASTACPCVTVNSAGPGTTHVVTLTGLASDTLYQAFVDATDASNNQQVSSAFTFRTLVAPPDSTPPAVAIVRPSGTVTGTAVVEATASDNVGVASVQFTVDGVNLGAPDTTAPYTISWDTTTVPDGPHTISAEARDAANNVATASAVVTVSQTPLPSTPHYVNFDGVDDHVRVPDTNALSFGTGVVDSPLTFEFWFRPDALTRQQLLGKGSENATEYRLFIASGGLRLDLRDASANATVSVYTDSLTALVGAWHHLAVVYDGRGGATAATGVTFYIDGVAVPVTRANNPAYVAMENLSGWLEIGRESTSWRQYDGALDELRLWTVARTLSEIQAGMTVELSGAEPGLVGYWRFNDGTGVTATDSGPVGLPAGLFNGTAWVAGGAMTPVEPDVTPPTITDLGSSNLTASGVTITFTTSEVATGRVSYTASTACPCVTVNSAGPGTTHVVTLTGLASDTLYQAFVDATDASNNQQVSSAFTFRTLVAPPDSTPPAVAIVRPSGTVTGTAVVEATASDNVGVASVQFTVDGVNLGAPDTTAPYTISWDTTTVPDGPHTISAEARDAANNVATASAVVTVSQTPLPSTPHYVNFDGVNDHVRVPDTNALSFGTGVVDSPLTFELWLRPDVLTRQQLLGKGSENATEYRLFIASGGLRLDLRDASANATVSVYTDSLTALVGAWHHLAVVYDGRGGATAATGVTFYIDGVAVPVTRANNPAYVAMENLSGWLEIGRESTSWRQYDGALDELRLWTVARTLSEIQAGMTVELSGAEPGLVGYWRFNDGTGVTATDSGPVGLPAGLFNGTAWVAGGAMN